MHPAAYKRALDVEASAKGGACVLAVPHEQAVGVSHEVSDFF